MVNTFLQFDSITFRTDDLGRKQFVLGYGGNDVCTIPVVPEYFIEGKGAHANQVTCYTLQGIRGTTKINLHD